MQKASKQLIYSAILLGFSLAVSSILYWLRPSTELSEPVYNPITVDIAIAETETIRIPIQAQGNVSAVHQTQLQAEVKGKIMELAKNFEVGGFIKRNEVYDMYHENNQKRMNIEYERDLKISLP